MKWMNCAAGADNYPTDGIGGVSATSSASGFADGKSWADTVCVVHGVTVNPGTAAGTVTITSHDGTTRPRSAIKAVANGSSFYVPLPAVELEGIKVVCAGTACTAVVDFESGALCSYSAT